MVLVVCFRSLAGFVSFGDFHLVALHQSFLNYQYARTIADHVISSLNITTLLFSTICFYYYSNSLCFFFEPFSMRNFGLDEMRVYLYYFNMYTHFIGLLKLGELQIERIFFLKWCNTTDVITIYWFFWNNGSESDACRKEKNRDKMPIVQCISALCWVLFFFVFFSFFR